MRIIGIAGAKNSGKDTVAEFLGNCAKDEDPSCRVYKVAFADAMKRMLLPLGYPERVLWGPSEKRSWVHPVFKLSARVMLQQVGEVVRQINPDFWVLAWSNDVDKLEIGNYTYSPVYGPQKLASVTSENILVLASDLRFENEHAELARRKAVTALVERNQSGQVADLHISEQWCRDAARQSVNVVVANDGTLAELEAMVKGVWGLVEK